jgi:hypothetical protein
MSKRRKVIKTTTPKPTAHPIFSTRDCILRIMSLSDVAEPTVFISQFINHTWKNVYNQLKERRKELDELFTPLDVVHNCEEQSDNECTDDCPACIIWNKMEPRRKVLRDMVPPGWPYTRSTQWDHKDCASVSEITEDISSLNITCFMWVQKHHWPPRNQLSGPIQRRFMDGVISSACERHSISLLKNSRFRSIERATFDGYRPRPSYPLKLVLTAIVVNNVRILSLYLAKSHMTKIYWVVLKAIRCGSNDTLYYILTHPQRSTGMLLDMPSYWIEQMHDNLREDVLNLLLKEIPYTHVTTHTMNIAYRLASYGKYDLLRATAHLFPIRPPQVYRFHPNSDMHDIELWAKIGIPAPTWLIYHDCLINIDDEKQLRSLIWMRDHDYGVCYCQLCQHLIIHARQHLASTEIDMSNWDPYNIVTHCTKCHDLTWRRPTDRSEDALVDGVE